MSRAALSEAVVRVSHAIYNRGWVANHDGNVSVRLDEERFLVTPTAISKADAREAALAVTDATGKPVEGETRPPSEFALHLGCYEERPDVGAVVHAHPPYATAMACAGKTLTTFLPEAVVSLGLCVPLTEFALPFGATGAAPLRELIREHDALLLAQHGVISVGKDLEQAILRMELVEHMARVYTLALPHGGVQELPPEVLKPLVEKRRSAGLGAAAERTPLPGALPASEALAESLAEAPTPTPSAPAATQSDRSWRPAGPAPAADAWSGGSTEATCSVVYGATAGDQAERLESAVAEAVGRHLKEKN
ncbi:MAG: class II aldolase/adducin family protein [Myxococcota bacterium]|nr:class II aldolase/adducin family protein [Myxococcota bacterium]